MNEAAELRKTIENLAKAVNEKKCASQKTTVFYTVAYAMLALFVVAYTAIIFGKIKEYVTPDAISAVVMNKVRDSLPDVNKAVVSRAKEAAPMIADKAVEAVNNVIPKAEDMIKEALKNYSRVIVVQIKTEVFPQFLKILRDNAKPISESAEALSDEATAKELAKTVADEIRKEIDDKLICYEFFQKLKEVTGELDKISDKPSNELTAKEAAERKLIVCWVYLVKKGDINGVFNTSLKRLSFFWQDLAGKIVPEGIAKELQAVKPEK
jgi:hypothetical protein